jgi:hypothetical protein
MKSKPRTIYSAFAQMTVEYSVEMTTNHCVHLIAPNLVRFKRLVREDQAERAVVHAPTMNYKHIDTATFLTAPLCKVLYREDKEDESQQPYRILNDAQLERNGRSEEKKSVRAAASAIPLIILVRFEEHMLHALDNSVQRWFYNPVIEQYNLFAYTLMLNYLQKVNTMIRLRSDGSE